MYEIYPLQSNLGGVLEGLRLELGDERVGGGKIGKVQVWVEREEEVRIARERLGGGRIKGRVLEVGVGR